MEIDFPKITFDLIYELSDDEKQDRPNTFKREESASVSRCVSISAADLDSIERSRHEANTVKQTSWAVNCFKTWLSERKIQIDLKTIAKSEFAAILRPRGYSRTPPVGISLTYPTRWSTILL